MSQLPSLLELYEAKYAELYEKASLTGNNTPEDVLEKIALKEAETEYEDRRTELRRPVIAASL